MAEEAGKQAGLLGEYQGYTPDTDLDRACELFQAKYGYLPLNTFTTAGAILAGPIGARRRSLAARAEAVKPLTPEAARQLVMEFEDTPWVT